MEDRVLRIPEVARLLGIDGKDVYGLVDSGELQAGKGPDGLVYVTEKALAEYQAAAAARPT